MPSGNQNSQYASEKTITLTFSPWNNQEAGPATSL